VILIAGVEGESAKYTALDPDTGTVCWTKDVELPYAMAALPSKGKLLFLSRDTSRGVLESVDVRSGVVTSRHAFPEGTFDEERQPCLVVSSDELFVLGKQIHRMSLSEDKPLWSVRDEILDGTGVRASLMGDRISLSSSTGVAVLALADGKAIWRSAAEGGALQLATHFGNVVYSVVSHSASKKTFVKIRAMNCASGKTLWVHASPLELTSHLAVEDGRLFFTRADSLIALNCSSGKLVSLYKFPKAFLDAAPSSAEGMGLPDIIQFTDTVVYVAREMAGIMAFSRKKGKLLWSHQHRRDKDGTYVYSMSSRLTAPLGFGDLGAWYPPPARAIKASPPADVVRSKNVLLEISQRNYEHAKARRDTVMRSPYAKTSDRQAAHRDVGLAAQSGKVSASMDMSFRRAEASVQLSQSTATAITDFMQGFGQYAAKMTEGALSHRRQLELNGVVRMHQNCFQGRYYVRPFKASDRGVTLVDLKTGKRCDFIYSPACLLHHRMGIETAHFAIDPEGKFLIAMGFSLRADQYQEWRKKQYKLPKASLLAYDIDRLKFLSAGTQ